MALDLSFLNVFNPKARPLFGLDISSSAVKMVELSEPTPGKYRIERYTIEA
ncbi:MAG: pilus assembly protein PilM, partial [Rhodocyclaceae bacterium]|nr:pilus assembly protein PilM [Rhodocyclaceae bacterium]